MTRCQSCKGWKMVGDEVCDRCHRLARIGIVVQFIAGAREDVLPLWRPGSPAARNLQLTYGPLDLGQLKALDAVADLLTDHARTRREHQGRLREAERETTAAARDSYAAGLFEGIDQRNRG